MDPEGKAVFPHRSAQAERL